MDVQSPAHLERLRDQPEIKAALLRHYPERSSDEARFERAAKNAAYWPLIAQLSERLIVAERSEEVREVCEVYGRPCMLVATSVSESRLAPYAIAVIATDGARVDEVLDELRSVTYDYWFGSSFFK